MLGLDKPGTTERSVSKFAENTWAPGLLEPSMGTQRKSLPFPQAMEEGKAGVFCCPLPYCYLGQRATPSPSQPQLGGEAELPASAEEVLREGQRVA